MMIVVKRTLMFIQNINYQSINYRILMNRYLYTILIVGKSMKHVRTIKEIKSRREEEEEEDIN